MRLLISRFSFIANEEVVCHDFGDHRIIDLKQVANLSPLTSHENDNVYLNPIADGLSL